MTIVLARDAHGREVLWQCSTCGKPFNLGWGSRCNRCIEDDRKHNELIAVMTRHIWQCDTCHKYVKPGVSRCLICSVDKSAR